MTTSNLLEAWRALLPTCVKVSAGPVLDQAPALTFTERVSAGIDDGERLRKFQSRRAYAKRALLMLGVDDAELTIGANRATVWPDGIVGSISHARDGNQGHVVATVGRACNIHAVGIDVEFDRGPHPDTWPIFMTAQELKRISKLSVQMRTIEALKIWCLKEASTKAIRRSIDPTELETKCDQDGDEYLITWAVPGNGTRIVRTLHGRTRRLQGLVMAAAVSKNVEA
jgi:4'-phosphopantetheinyl transferase EntD